MASENDSPAGSVSYLTVGPGDAGRRLDNFLVRHRRGVPMARLQRAIRRGEVRVNGGRRKSSYRLVAGDRVRVPPLVVATRSRPVVSESARESIANAVLYEDEALVVVNKPSGWAVHGGTGISAGVVEVMRTLSADYSDLDLVHRIDRATSGCLVLAKRRSALRALHASFRDGLVEKRYLALVAGRWPRRRTRCDLALDVTKRAGGERFVQVSLDGKAAATRFGLKERFDIASLIEVQPLTGRTHQIRVHTAHFDAPVAGDERYGDAEFNATMRKLGLARLFLHAHEIAFEYPEGEIRRFNAPLAKDLDAVLKALRETSQRSVG